MQLNVDISNLNTEDRLAVAACRLNCWEWDDLVGPKPDGFDDLPEFSSTRRCKHDYTSPAIEAIKTIVGSANISRSWWIYFLGKTEEEWLHWYVSEHVRAARRSKRIHGE